MASKKIDRLSFDATLEELETIVHQLEQGSLPLEEALKQFEQGIHLVRAGQQKLEQAEQKIQILLTQADGSLNKGQEFDGPGDPRGLSLGDISGDGKPDLVTNRYNGFRAIATSGGTGARLWGTNPPCSLQPAGSPMLLLADFDDDASGEVANVEDDLDVDLE